MESVFQFNSETPTVSVNADTELKHLPQQQQHFPFEGQLQKHGILGAANKTCMSTGCTQIMDIFLINIDGIYFLKSWPFEAQE